jgi:transcriptional regulator with XRE-family HTH domain
VNKKQNIVGPSIRALRMGKGWSQESLSMRLKWLAELLAKQACEN